MVAMENVPPQLRKSAEQKQIKRQGEHPSRLPAWERREERPAKW